MLAGPALYLQNPVHTWHARLPNPASLRIPTDCPVHLSGSSVRSRRYFQL